MNQTKRRSNGFSLLIAGLTGVAMMWLFDPKQGNRRRHLAMEKAGRLTRQLGRLARRKTMYAGSRVAGIVREKSMPPDNPFPDDTTLKDRVESELFRHREIPKGRIDINVVDGIVELRGEVDSMGAVFWIEDRVRQIDGAQRVHNYLHVRGTNAPNKESAIAASAQ